MSTHDTVDLDDATQPGPDNSTPADPGEFAARWNLQNPTERTEWLARHLDTADVAYRCMVRNHEHRIALADSLGRLDFVAAGGVEAAWALHSGGPLSRRLHRRDFEAGYDAAARAIVALHHEGSIDSFGGMLGCVECSNLDTAVAWPCRTVLALGLPPAGEGSGS